LSYQINVYCVEEKGHDLREEGWWTLSSQFFLIPVGILLFVGINPGHVYPAQLDVFPNLAKLRFTFLYSELFC